MLMLPARIIILSFVYDYPKIVVTAYSDTFGFEQTFLADLANDDSCRDAIQQINDYVMSIFENLDHDSTTGCIYSALEQRFNRIRAFADIFGKGRDKEIFIPC